MKKLKYTTAHISKLVQKEIEQLGGIQEYSSKFNVPKDILQLFYRRLNYFDLELYQLASKILNIQLQELTEIEKVDIDSLKDNVQFRESVNMNTEYDYENLNIDLEQSVKIFSIIIDSYKLRGDQV